MEKNPVDLNTDNSIGIITINDTPHNYLKSPVLLEKNKLIDFVKNNSLKGIIIQGKGKHFSAGADIEKIYKDVKRKNFHSEINLGNEVLNYLENINIPIVAAIEGICFGGGLEIALACHIRIASERSLFAFPEIINNLIPGLGGIQRIQNILQSQGKSIELVLSGETINANTAHRIHLVDYLVPSKKAFEFSIELLKRITNDRPLTIINSVMQSINNIRTMTYEEALYENARLFFELASQKPYKKQD